jgi:hypothetical protein
MTDEQLRKIIKEKAELRFNELKNKNFEWKSFYNGFLEGAVIVYMEGLKNG